jgi:hypothetical protein
MKNKIADVTIKITGPRLVINNSLYIIQKALEDVGCILEIENECLDYELDGDGFPTKTLVSKDKNLAWALEHPPELVKIEMVHCPWGG